MWTRRRDREWSAHLKLRAGVATSVERLGAVARRHRSAFEVTPPTEEVLSVLYLQNLTKNISVLTSPPPPPQKCLRFFSTLFLSAVNCGRGGSW